MKIQLNWTVGWEVGFEWHGDIYPLARMYHMLGGSGARALYIMVAW